MKQVRGSNSGFVRNGEVLSKDAASCLRTILVRDLGLPEPKPSRTFRNVMAIGQLNEIWFAATKSEARRELLITEPVMVGVEFEGHADFVDDEFVYETKSVTSKRVYSEIFKKGKYKPGNLAQLVRYMLTLDRTLGKLVYTSYTDIIDYSELSFLSEEEVIQKLQGSAGETRVFEVEITQVGEILVDRELTGFTVTDSWEHLFQAAEYLLDETKLPPRPAGFQAAYASPCHFCPLKEICDSQPATKQEFLDLVTIKTKESYDNATD